MCLLDVILLFMDDRLFDEVVTPKGALLDAWFDMKEGRVGRSGPHGDVLLFHYT